MGRVADCDWRGLALSHVVTHANSDVRAPGLPRFWPAAARHSTLVQRSSLRASNVIPLHLHQHLCHQNDGKFGVCDHILFDSQHPSLFRVTAVCDWAAVEGQRANQLIASLWFPSPQLRIASHNFLHALLDEEGQEIQFVYSMSGYPVSSLCHSHDRMHAKTQDFGGTLTEAQEGGYRQLGAEDGVPPTGPCSSGILGFLSASWLLCRV